MWGCLTEPRDLTINQPVAQRLVCGMQHFNGLSSGLMANRPIVGIKHNSGLNPHTNAPILVTMSMG